MTSPHPQTLEARLLFVVAVIAAIAVGFVGGVFAFSPPTDPDPWLGTGFIASFYVGLYLLLFRP